MPGDEEELITGFSHVASDLLIYMIAILTNFIMTVHHGYPALDAPTASPGS
jgi:hypothetical protein